MTFNETEYRAISTCPGLRPNLKSVNHIPGRLLNSGCLSSGSFTVICLDPAEQ